MISPFVEELYENSSMISHAGFLRETLSSSLLRMIFEVVRGRRNISCDASLLDGGKTYSFPLASDRIYPEISTSSQLVFRNSTYSILASSTALGKIFQNSTPAQRRRGINTKKMSKIKIFPIKFVKRYTAASIIKYLNK